MPFGAPEAITRTDLRRPFPRAAEVTAATAWLLRWVSKPSTPLTCSRTMDTRFFPFGLRTAVVAVGPGEVTAWQNGMSYVEMVDKLLIGPMRWTRPTSTSGKQLG
ncbi:hypothetical protein GCM10010129_82760 [Streptomyces fumigatiscleroticus]|nr:hypothetical protein GCM10010129_82760 [Streptomyces fumigatiscleroticus]